VAVTAVRRPARWFWILTGLVGGFFLLDLALFYWLVSRSLSQQELDRVLLEARQEAQELADRLARSAGRTGGDLFTAVALEQETQTYIDSVLRQRRIVQTVEVTDRNGVLVMRQRGEAAGETPGEGAAVAGFGSLDVSVPIGEHGALRIGLSPAEMSSRLDQLRSGLVRQMSWIGGLTGLVVAGAVALLSVLIRRGERLEQQARETEQLAYVGTLAAGLAHEIRNPLNSLNLNMQLLEEDLPAGDVGEASRRLTADLPAPMPPVRPTHSTPAR